MNGKQMEGGKELYVGYHQSKEERAAQQVRLNSRNHKPTSICLMLTGLLAQLQDNKFSLEENPT